MAVAAHNNDIFYKHSAGDRLCKENISQMPGLAATGTQAKPEQAGFITLNESGHIQKRFTLGGE